MKTKNDFIDTVRLFEVIEKKIVSATNSISLSFCGHLSCVHRFMSSVKVDWDQRAEENFLERKYSMRNEVFKGSSEVEMKFLKGNSQK